MDARELRLNNWVLARGNPIQVNIIQNHKEDKRYYINEINEDFFDGIPLTEEWLVKLGFTKTIKEKPYFSTDYVYTLDSLIGFKITLRAIAALWGNDTSWTVISHESSFEPHVVSMDYVHQVQNLIGAISYKELEIKQ